MRHLLRNSILVAIVLAFFVWAIIPPEEKLRLGKDLRGGVSLVYSVQIDDAENAGEVIDKTIEVLKKRVDPEGLMEISMVAQGRDRIEITMPRAGPHVAELRAVYDEKLEGLRSGSLDSDEFELVMRLPAGERDERIAAMAGGNESLAESIGEASIAFDRAKDARERYEQAVVDALPQDQIDTLIGEVADAEVGYEEQRDVALASAISPGEVDRVLRLPARTRLKKVQATGEMREIESPRERAWGQMLDRYPERSDQLAEIREAYETYETERTTLDDPNDLVRLLRGAGVLEFRITVDPGDHPEEARLRSDLREVGPRNVRSPDTVWLRVNDIDNWYQTVEQWDYLRQFPSAYFQTYGQGYVGEEYNGEFYLLAWDTPGSRLTRAEGDGWSVSGAGPTTDDLGRPAISFTMNALGSEKLRELTSSNQGNRMAIVLDDQIYTAPNINSTISSRGIIEGEFSQQEINYIKNVLGAGSLQAKLSERPISQSSIGPDLGHDNLISGMNAGIWALAAVSVFMIFYYFAYGMVAVICLACNAVLILGAMSLNRAAFTLPGIAGVILTFGMAVDANVLIYERIREELREGSDLRASIRLGYQRALSAIVDGNVTNLIVCFVLAYFGTQEIKGFAITLGIGVVATLFSALIVTRIIFALLVDQIGIRKMPMLPMVIKTIERLLEPKIAWMSMRWGFLVVSVVAIGVGMSVLFSFGKNMLDIEFRGGTQVTLTFAEQDGSPIYQTRAEVEERVKSYARELDDEHPLRALSNPTVLPIDPREDGVSSDTFSVKTTATDDEAVRDALTDVFRAEIPELSALSFKGEVLGSDEVAPTFPIIQRDASGAAPLGASINRPDIRNDVQEFFGGAVLLIEDISPPEPAAAILERIERKAQSFSRDASYANLGMQGRIREVIVISGTARAAESVAVVIRDPSLTYFDNATRFEDEVMATEWELARAALSEPASTASVQNFSPAIASTFKGQAIGSVFISFLLIMIYIYVRFGSVRFSLAAIVTLLHDVLLVLGLIAIAGWIYDNNEGVAASLLLLPFKIDLSLVAALLTIIGYSLNDTIIIMDRIRENRGKLPYTSKAVINRSINQTVSRTVITSGTTFIAALLLYTTGGEGVREFSFALLAGIVVGTYSSIAIASPLVWSRRGDRPDEQIDAPPGVSAAPAG